MAGTRRSTRIAASDKTNYTASEYSSEETNNKGKDAQPTRRKRVRTDAVEKSAPPSKKASKPEEKSVTAPKPNSSSTTSVKPTLPPISISESNRTPEGEQEVFWLLKAEPLPRYENGVNVAFSVDDLAACTKPEPWSGVRNPQARNNMQAMRKGDLGFFYHSNAKPSGVVGILRVVEEAAKDDTAFDKKDPYFDAKSDPANPKWYCVGVEFVKKFENAVDLATIKSFANNGGQLAGMQLVTNSRLSVCKVRREEWEFILELAGETGAAHGNYE
ncbi:PUA-like domain-containing protein [Phaeosphaeria sp. MPI-PUGE-AT-0046c]|nr:PUA-like domain-containing protein [Phaeosphaeria sp. MPI-PUGE-AT-0046c]